MTSTNMSRRANRLRLTSLEDRLVPAGWLATAVDEGGPPHVIIRADTNNDGRVDAIRASFYAFDPAFRGGVRLTTADFDGDGNDELVTAAGPGGGPHIKIWNVSAQGQLGGLREQFFGFDVRFGGGCWITGMDVDHDGRSELVVAAGEGGGPHVKMFSDVNNDGRLNDEMTDEFFAFNAAFRGGVRLTDAKFDGVTDYLVIAAGPGGGPHVKVYSNTGLTGFDRKLSNDPIVNQFFAFDANYLGGVHLAAANMAGGPSDELIVSGGNLVKVFNKEAGFYDSDPYNLGFEFGLLNVELHRFAIPSMPINTSIHVGVSNFVTNDGYADLVTSLEMGGGGRASIWSGDLGTGAVSVPPKDDEFAAFPQPNGQAYNVGVWTAFGNL